MPQPSLFIADTARLFDSAGKLEDTATAESLRGVLGAFAGWIERVAPAA